MAIQIITNNAGKQFMRATWQIGDLKKLEQAEKLGMKADNEYTDVHITFDPEKVVLWGATRYSETDPEGEHNRTFIDFVGASSITINESVEEFEKVFLNL